MFINALIAGAVIIVLALATYASMLLIALHKQKKHLNTHKQKRLDYLYDSVETIAKAMRSDECNLSEGVIRLNGLLPSLNMRLEDYKSMYQLYLVVMDMPTHEKRNEIPRNHRMRLDLTRESSEVTHEKGIKLDIERLLTTLQQKKRK